MTAFIRNDLAEYWRPALDHPERWLRDIWVDLGMLTVARAHAALRTGRLITKGEALAVLTELKAPESVVEDIRQRRYGAPVPSSEVPSSDTWLRDRARLTTAFLARTIPRVAQ